MDKPGDGPNPCPNCGRCPTCGHVPFKITIHPVQPYPYTYPWYYWNSQPQQVWMNNLNQANTAKFTS